MRLISHPLQQLLLSPTRHHVPRLEVQDAADAWRDLSPWFRSFAWSTDRDASGESGVLRLRREAMVDGVLHSLAPLVTSPLNETDGAFDPRLNPFRRVRLAIATVLSGTTPTDADYHRVFDGIIDDPSWGGRESVIELAVRDLAGPLQDAIFETETVIGSADGLPILDALQAILAAAGFPDLTVFARGDTAGWSVTPYVIPRGTGVWDACRTLALSIGWDFRYTWIHGEPINLVAPTLIEPPRDTETVLLTLKTTGVTDLPRLRLNGTEVRNFGEVLFTNTAGDGPNRAIYTDTGSVDAFGRRAFGLDERNNPNINSYATALAYITAAVLDMSTPYVEQDAVLPLLWHLEPGDVLEFPATPAPTALYDTAQRFGVVGYRHELASDGSGSTTVTLRGRPIGAYQRWLARLRQRAITEGRTGGPGALIGPLLGDGSAKGGSDGGVWLGIGFEARTAAVEVYATMDDTTPVPAPALNAQNLAAIVRRQEGATGGADAFSTLKFFAAPPTWYKLVYARAIGFDRGEGFPVTLIAQAVNGFEATMGAVTSLTVTRQGVANVLEWTADPCTSPHPVELLVWRNGEVIFRLVWAASGTWTDDGLPTDREYAYALQAFTHDGVHFARSGPRATIRRPGEEEPTPLPPPTDPGAPGAPSPGTVERPVWLNTTPITETVGGIPYMTQADMQCDDPLALFLTIESYDGSSWQEVTTVANDIGNLTSTTFPARSASAFRIKSLADDQVTVREYSATRGQWYVPGGGDDV